MLPYLVAAAATLALLASLYKDRAIESRSPRVVRALRIHHGVQLLLVGLALYSAIDAANVAQSQRLTQLLAALRDTTVSLRTDLEHRTTLRYLLSLRTNYRNAQLNASPAGLEIPESVLPGLVAKLTSLTQDLARTLGTGAPEALRANQVLSLLRDRSMGYVVYGDISFVQEMNTATTPAEQAAVQSRHPASCEPPSGSASEVASAHLPIVVAPGGRWYFMNHTKEILDGLAFVSESLEKQLSRLAGEA